MTAEQTRTMVLAEVARFERLGTAAWSPTAICIPGVTPDQVIEVLAGEVRAGRLRSDQRTYWRTRP